MSRGGPVSIRGDFLLIKEGRSSARVDSEAAEATQPSYWLRALSYLQSVHTLARLGVNVVHEMHDDTWRAKSQRMH
jgi:hypothetical protein